MSRDQFDPLVTTNFVACIARTNDTSEWKPEFVWFRACCAGLATSATAAS